MSFDQALDNLSEKLNSRLLVQEEQGYQKGAQCAPWPQELQKKPGLVMVKLEHLVACDLNGQKPWPGPCMSFKLINIKLILYI